MRALCGAIITAGALVGLGLLGVGIGIRYENYPKYNDKSEAQFVHFGQLDTALMIAFVVVIAALVIGLATAFVGLAYHHHRRHWEMNRHTAAPPPAGPPPAAGVTTGERMPGLIHDV